MENVYSSKYYSLVIHKFSESKQNSACGAFVVYFSFVDLLCCLWLDHIKFAYIYTLNTNSREAYIYLSSCSKLNSMYEIDYCEQNILKL